MQSASENGQTQHIHIPENVCQICYKEYKNGTGVKIHMRLAHAAAMPRTTPYKKENILHQKFIHPYFLFLHQI